jgi:hypothetical protein
MATAKKPGKTPSAADKTKSAAADAAVNLLSNPDVIEKLFKGGTNALSKLAAHLGAARDERRKNKEDGPGRRMMNPLGADRLAARIDSAMTISDDIGEALAPETPPALTELRDQINRLALSLKADRSLPAMRRFKRLREIDDDLDDLEDALFESIGRGGSTTL